MYVRSRTELSHSLALRRERRPEICQRRDDYVRWRFGIPDFSSLIKEHWGELQLGQDSVGVLCRQVASIMVEDVCCYMGCRLLGLQPWAQQLTRDGFRTVNLDKVHRVRIPWINWSKKGNLVLKYERVTTLSNDLLEGMRMMRIPTKDGSTLPEWHAQLRDKVFKGAYPLSDFSAFFEDCLHQATKKPEFVYCETDGGYETKMPCNGRIPGVRPPASWYYPLYFSLFLDGSLVVLETYENPFGGVPEAKRLFERSMGEVTEGVGWQPVVVEILPLTQEMMHYNRHLLDGVDMEGMVEELARELAEEDDILVLFSSIAERVRHIGYPSAATA